jgi:glycosyltransferase involved in cell wall biosynthesis
MSRVSCIVPTHDRADLLPGAVESIRNQTHEDLEIIVVDDASTDETPELIDDLEAADDRVVGLRTRQETPMGARNVGIEAATGEYIAFLDDDDRWHPEKIETQLRHLDGYSALSCVCRIVDPAGETVQRHDFEGVLEQDYEDVFRGIRYLYPSGTIAPAEHVYEIDGFDESLPEWDFYLRLVDACGPAGVLDRPLVEFNREDIERVSEQRRDTIDQFAVFERHEHRVSTSARRERLGNLHLARYRTEGERRIRLASLARALYYNPGTARAVARDAAAGVLTRLGLRAPVRRLLDGSD